jgi:nucleoside-diphosphate-sugar epimerase
MVTGGCGFVGRHLVRRLLQAGHEVWVLDDLSTGLHPDCWLEGILARHAADGRVQYSLACGSLTFVRGDLMVTLLQELGRIPRFGAALPPFDYIYALASVVGGRAKIDGDPIGVGIDLAIDATFFLWAVRNKTKIGKVLYASSSAAYPVKLQEQEGHVALTESMIDFETGDLGQPDMTYGWSKLTGEYLSRLAASHYGMSIACVRPFSGYGEDQDLTYPVPAIAYRVARGDDPVTVWGTGEQGRDFVHIEDCITAMMAAVDRIHDGSAVNIGAGKLTNFLEVAAAFVRLAGRTAAVRPTIGQPVGVQARYCDPSRTEQLLGWKPTISLDEGFGRVLKEACRRVRAGDSSSPQLQGFAA